MQTLTVSAHQLRNRLGEYLNLVYYQGREIIIKKMGKPVAKLTLLKKEKEKRAPEEFDVDKYYGAFKIGKRLSLKRMKEIIREAVVKRNL